MGDLENTSLEPPPDLKELLEEGEGDNTGTAEDAPEDLSAQLSLIEASARAEAAGDEHFEKIEAGKNSCVSDADDSATLRELLTEVSCEASASLNPLVDQKIRHSTGEPPILLFRSGTEE